MRFVATLGVILALPLGEASAATRQVFTVAAFWCPGRFNGGSWIPLFLRRGYRKHLVFS
jgi:hypothetical protein